MNYYRAYSVGWYSIRLFSGGKLEHGVRRMSANAAVAKQTGHRRYRA